MRLPGAEVVSVARGTSVEAAARELEAQPDVLFAEPNYIYRPMATPSDPRFGALWALQQGTDRDIDAPEAWEEQTGSAAIKVAIVDTGVAYDHPDLAANMLAGCASSTTTRTRETATATARTLRARSARSGTTSPV
jgi:subtilisin family serine protease